MLQICDLKILSIHNPIGISEMPYFSYCLKSDRQNVRQVEYEITVSVRGKTVWKDRKKDEQSTFIRYGGELKSKTQYDVSVTVTDNYGEQATQCGFFETAMLGAGEWKAKWVKSTLPITQAEKGFGKQPPATWFISKFTCGKKIKKARLYATCHGIYVPYLNGERFSEGEFAPEHSTYGKVLFYQTYDITDKLKKGENTFSMYVGDGWYLGVKTMPRVKNYERRHAVLFQLEIEYEDGSVLSVLSDENTECAYGKVVCSDLFSGERYDDNREIGDCRKAEFADYGYDNLVAQFDWLSVCTDELPVKEIITTPQGETLLDFGKVIAGRVRMRINEKNGAVVRLTHTEILDKDGSFFQNTDMPDGGVEQIDEFISAGKPIEYEPIFTYHGFRYVKIEGIKNPRKENFTARAYSSQKENVGSFSCSNELLNKLYANIRNSQNSNMISIPTDCPQREKAGWTGDIAIYAKTALLNEEVTPFLRRWLKSVRADQSKSGAVPQIVPYDGGYPMSEVFFGKMFDETDTFGVAGWSDCCVLVPWAIYEISGNREVLKENFDVMEKWCEYILKRAKMPRVGANIPPEYDEYLWNNGFQQGDWLVPSIAKNAVQYEDAMTGSLTFQTNFAYEYSVPMYGYRTFDIMQKIADILGDKEKSDYYGGVAEKMKTAIQKVYFDESGKLRTNYMGGYVLALAFDLAPDEEQVKAQLIESLARNGGCLDTGFLSTPYLLDALNKIGRKDLAYSVLYQNKCPSWLYEVECGATSIWESWESFEEDGTPKKISFNHYAFGCVADWIFRNICGIVPTSAGFKTMRIVPIPDKTLTEAERTYSSVYGDISVRWKRANGTFTLDCEIPCNTTAEIVLPSGKTETVGSGKYTFSEVIAE